MICSDCWASVPAGRQKCPRCGAKVTGAPPSVLGLLKSYPWLAVLLTLSFLVTLWAATRRAPVPKPIPDAVEPAVEIPAPTPEPETSYNAPPPMPVPAPAPEAPAEPARPAPQPQPETPAPAIGPQRPDGTWEAGPPRP